VSKVDVKSMLGEAVRRGGQSRALGALDERASDLAGALRRSVPVLLRRGVPIQPAPARMARIAELMAEIPGPVFEVPLVTDPGGSRALLCFSGPATSYLVDAALGGTGEPDPSQPEQRDISSPQRAVAARMAGEMVGAISDVLAGLGLRLRRIPTGPDAPFGGELVVVTFQIGDAPNRQMVLAMSRDVVQASTVGVATAGRSSDVASRVAGVLAQVEVEISVELGRIRRSLQALERLRIDDVLRLDTPIRSPLVMRCEDRPVFLALPTTAGTQLAVTVLDRIEGLRSERIERAGASPVGAIDNEP